MALKFAKPDVVEAVGVIRVVGTALAATSRNHGVPGATLLFATSSLSDNAETVIRSGNIAAPVAATFDAARIAGATYSGMVKVVMIVETLSPVGMPAKAVAAASVRFGLGQIARILSATAFTSRNEVDTTLVAVAALFDRAETYAADEGDRGSYAALVRLHAALSADLTTRSRPLPRMVAYSFPRTFSGLSLAHRLYGDASRSVELATENGVFNPAFMPRMGEALSA